MAKPEVMVFDYKEIVQVAITFRKPPRKCITEYTPPNAPENILRELLPMCYYLTDKYTKTGKIPTIEEAKAFSAYICIDKEAFGGDLTIWNPIELAKEAGVTPEFAQFRIDLELETPPTRIHHE